MDFLPDYGKCHAILTGISSFLSKRRKDKTLVGRGRCEDGVGVGVGMGVGEVWALHNMIVCAYM